jgi:glutathione S-transferase
MITLHHLNSSRSQRVLWLLEELGVEYELRRYQRDPATLKAPPSLQAVHFLGKAPTISDGNQTLAESGAIVEYLVRRYGAGRLVPPYDTPEHVRYTHWIHYAEGSAMLPLVLRLMFRQMPHQPMPALARPVVRAMAKNVIDTFVQPQIERHLDYMDRELASSAWFAGDAFTAADIQMSFPVEVAAMRGGIEKSHPRLSSYLQRIHARPAYERALAKGGPYDLSDLGG